MSMLAVLALGILTGAESLAAGCAQEEAAMLQLNAKDPKDGRKEASRDLSGKSYPGKPTKGALAKKKKWNYIFITTDEQRKPTRYEMGEPDFADVKQFLEQEMVTQEELKKHGLQFENHYIGTTACVPSRATIYTGQYPSLHGVAQTDGIGKDMHAVYWLNENQMPTMGSYFRSNGYETILRGKWHVSHADLPIGGSWLQSIATNDENGTRNPTAEELYKRSKILEPFGWSGWIGPEPHGALKTNAGTLKDEIFANQTIQVLRDLQARYKQDGVTGTEEKPFFLAANFLNPHDIVLEGIYAQHGIDIQPKSYAPGEAPEQVPLPPTFLEASYQKPQSQKDFVQRYATSFMPQPPDENYRKWYYYLQRMVERTMKPLLDELKKSPFYEDTIVVYTSDHGDMMAAHGNMHQKWHQMYEESSHVNLIVSNPVLFPSPLSSNVLTNHVDLIPTLLGLSGLNASAAYDDPSARPYYDGRALVGTDLSDYIYEVARAGAVPSEEPDTAVYYMTDDEILNARCNSQPRFPWQRADCDSSRGSVPEPNNIDAVITRLAPSEGSPRLLVKAAFYWNGNLLNADYEETYATADQINKMQDLAWERSDTDCRRSYNEPCSTVGEFETYILEAGNTQIDPYETHNLAFACSHYAKSFSWRSWLVHSTGFDTDCQSAWKLSCKEACALQEEALAQLKEQRSKKRLSPRTNFTDELTMPYGD